MRVLRDEPRLNRDALRYGFAVGKVRVLETRTLDNAAYERLIDAHSFTDQKRLLAETAYGRFLEHAWTAEEVESALDRALDSFYRFLEQAELPEPVVRFFRVRHDFTNLKAFAKAQLFGVPVDELLVGHGSVPLDAFRDGAEAIPQWLRAHLPEEADTPLAIDAAIDRALFAELQRLAAKASSPFLRQVAALLVDIANIKTLVRGRLSDMPPARVADLLVGGGTLGLSALEPMVTLSLPDLAEDLVRLPHLKGVEAELLRDTSSLDLVTDAALMRVLRAGRRTPIGPEPVISYVLAREIEVAALRVLLLGKLGGIGPETLRTRLRASYR